MRTQETITINSNLYLIFPCGGKRALTSIMESGGFLDFDNAVWLQAMA